MSNLEKKELRVVVSGGDGEMLSGDRDAVPSVLVDASIARQMSDMIRAFRISQIIGTIAQLGIPDQLASGARTATELASLIGSHAGATHRLMRAASDLGLVAWGSDARFTAFLGLRARFCSDAHVSTASRLHDAQGGRGRARKIRRPREYLRYASVKILTDAGYQTLHSGDNGYVCMVLRGWSAPTYTPVQVRGLVYDSTVRAPICFDPLAARMVLPYYELRSKLGSEGKTLDQIAEAIQAA
jgi:hypothetical protein